MQINLIPKITVKGYSQLHGVSHTRIKARSKRVNENTHCNATDAIRASGKEYISEYRLVKEKGGYIFREVLQDTGINGHHKTMKQAIIRALGFVTIYVDEPFEWQELSEFKKLEKQHRNREKGCKHSHNNSGRHDINFLYEIPREAGTCEECGEYWPVIRTALCSQANAV